APAKVACSAEKLRAAGGKTLSDRVEIPRVETGIFADEIGIAVGIYGEWRLKTAFRPIFARAGDGFRPVAVEASIRPFVFGREVDERMFRRAVPPRDRPIMAAIGVALAMRNLEHTGVFGLRLLLDAELGPTISSTKVKAAARALLAQ